jgi:hypothetical protein
MAITVLRISRSLFARVRVARFFGLGTSHTGAICTSDGDGTDRSIKRPARASKDARNPLDAHARAKEIVVGIARIGSDQFASHPPRLIE